MTRLLAVEALLEVQRRVAPYLDLQLVAFPQDGVLRSRRRARQPEARARHGRRCRRRHSAFRAHDGRRRGVGDRCFARSRRRRGLRVDMHCDETDDPMSRHIETLAFETQRLGLHGRVTGSHLTSMHSHGQLLRQQAAAADRARRASRAIANPLINITLQGRHDTYPKRRGMTRVPELMAAGIDVAFGHDCVMDPWYSLGSRRHAGSRAHGPARGADDGPGMRCARLLRRGDGDRPARILGLEATDRAGLPRRPRAAGGARSDRGDPAAGHAPAVIRRGQVIAEPPRSQARCALAPTFDRRFFSPEALSTPVVELNGSLYPFHQELCTAAMPIQGLP